MKKKTKEKRQKPPDKRVEREQEYEDYFLAKQSHLSQNTLIEILLGFPKKGLENAKRQVWRISTEGIAEREAKVEAAIKAAGTHLGTFTDTAHPATVRRHESLYKLPNLPEGLIEADCLSAGQAHEHLLKWMSLQFSQVRGEQPYPTVEFFEWIESDEILEKLKSLGVKIPPRASRFIKFVKKWDKENRPKEPKKPLHETKPESQVTAGRKPSPIALAVVEEARRIQGEKPGIPMIKMAWMKRIVEILNPAAKFDDLQDIRPEEYRNRFGRKPVTVAKWIAEGLK